MESGMKELIRYRMERAEEMLAASEDNLKAEHYRTSLNRSYYAVFHAMRAVNLLMLARIEVVQQWPGLVPA